MRALRIVGRDQTGITKRAEILAGEKREAAERADVPDRTRPVGRANRLRRVFDDRDPGTRGNCDDGIEVGAQPEQVYGDDRLRSRRDCRDRLAGVDVERHRVDVNQHRTGAQTDDRAGGRKKRVG
jgi:hypothetical protein